MANQPKKYKKFVATAATATLVASAIVPVASAKSFSDVPANNEFQPFIDALSETGIINGYADGTFKPGAKLTRGQVVKMLGRWIEANGAEVPSDWETVQRFNDVPVSNTDKELVKYAALVKDEGVFTGSNGNLSAANNITRQQMAKVLNGAYAAVNGTSLVDLADNIDNKLVTDLASAQQEFEGYIQALVDLEISTVSVFRPSENVTRAQFAKFLYNTIKVEAVGAAGVKAINNTTVEVTFKDAIEDIKALDFTIEGLKVENAVVKQTDAKTAVLTTESQKAGTEYTVSVNDKEVGTFTGISAVLPESITLVERSIQGVVGQEVTLQAKVTVKEGQSAAGIPVTFNIPTSNTSFNQPIVAEAKTNEQGVATYTYTRYANGTDNVVVYATGDRTKSKTANVYWAAAKQLTVKDITEATTLVNGTNKVYEINSAKNANGFVFVTFAENLNVTPDKLVKGVSAQGISTYTLNSSGTVTSTVAPYPYEVTTGGKAVIAVKLDSNGKANLVLAGSNASVTPIVFEGVYDGTGSTAQDYDAEYLETSLQAKASTVKFELKHQLGLTVEALGSENAAKYLNPTETGGRDYKLTYTDKDGKAVANNTTVKVAIDTIGLKGNFRLLDSKGNSLPVVNSVNGKNYYNVLIEKDGQATFTVTSDQANDYVSPVVFIDNGKTSGANVLDTDDLQANAAITYFVDSVTYAAKLEVLGADGKAAKPVLADNSQFVDFVYKLVDQNGKPRRAVNATDVTFNITAGPGILRTANGDLAPGQSTSVTAQISSTGTQVSTRVYAKEASTASVSATGSTAGVVLPSTEPTVQTATFLSTSALVDGVTYAGATVTGVDKDANKVTLNINGNNHTVEYGNGSLYIAGVTKTIVDFEAALSVGDIVTYVPGATPYFDITTNNAADVTAPTATVAYNAATPVTTDVYAKHSILNGTDELVFTATEYGAQYNGVEVVLENVVLNSAATTASVGVVAGKTVITVELKDDGTDITATFADVISAVNAQTALTKVTASAAAPTTTAVAGTATLAGGSSAAAAAPATITVTFNEPVANPNEVVVTATKSLGTAPVYSWNSAKTVLTLTLASDAATTFTTGDVITVTGAKDASGNTQVLNPVLP